MQLPLTRRQTPPAPWAHGVPAEYTGSFMLIFPAGAMLVAGVRRLPIMLEGFKRLFSGATPAPASEWEGIAPWAESRQYAFRGVHNDGFVIDGRVGVTPWRMEWGPSQRPYITGSELRLRAEMGLPAELQIVLMNRVLCGAMETSVFEQAVEGVQTRIDNQTPPEMRWLVMYPKLPGSDMPLLRERYVAISSVKGWLQHWLDGSLTASLAAVSAAPEVPVVLMIGRGRLMLRTAVPDAQIGVVQGWLRVFENAIRAARRVVEEGSVTDTLVTAPSLWPASALPGDERKP